MYFMAGCSWCREGGLLFFYVFFKSWFYIGNLGTLAIVIYSIFSPIGKRSYVQILAVLAVIFHATLNHVCFSFFITLANIMVSISVKMGIFVLFLTLTRNGYKISIKFCVYDFHDLFLNISLDGLLTFSLNH